MVYPLSCIKHLIIFGKDNQTSILSLLPHLQDHTANTGRIITHTHMHIFLYNTDIFIPSHYNFTAVCMWNNTNYIDK